MSPEVADRFLGAVYERGSEEYERVRRAPRRSEDWNLRTHDRYPELIVEAVTDADVVEAVKLARERGLKIKARSGGHSWTDASVRDGTILVDLSFMNQAAFDAKTLTGVVGAGAKGNEIGPVLEANGLYFPTGGCQDIGLGGFILQGGFGFNRPRTGPACMSVSAIDLVNAEGELLHADEESNSDYFWAARGAGGGFFGVITRFYLNLRPLPKHSLSNTYLYPMEIVEDVVRWFMTSHDAGFADGLQVSMILLDTLTELSPTPTGPVLHLAASYSADTEEEAVAALAFLDEVPFADQAVFATRHRRVKFSDRYQMTKFFSPDGWTYVADNLWTDAPYEQFAPLLLDAFGDRPTRRSHVIVEAYHPFHPTDMAFSVEGKYYVALYGVADETDTVTQTELSEWTTRHLLAMEPYSNGIQFADENVAERPSNGLSLEHAAHLEELRAQHDPEGIFEGYLE